MVFSVKTAVPFTMRKILRIFTVSLVCALIIKRHFLVIECPKKQFTHVEKSLNNESIFIERQLKIESLCGEEFQSESIKSEHILVLKSHKLAWCPVFKAGSSTWISILLKMADTKLVILFCLNESSKWTFIFKR